MEEPKMDQSEPDATQVRDGLGSSLQRSLLMEPGGDRFLNWVLVGDHGIRVGWMVVLFLVLTYFLLEILWPVGEIIRLGLTHSAAEEFGVGRVMRQESIQLVSPLVAAIVCARIEGRRIVDYNLCGPNRRRNFLTGVVAGFLALSLLVGALHQGGWIHFGSMALTGGAIFSQGALWALAFLLTGLSEEGMTRCYLLYTLTRGINYFWALGTVGALCGFTALNPQSNGAGGVYGMAALGLLPCLLLQLKRDSSAGFWQAAWLTSTLFGYLHTFNDGETWIGIFSAALIGFVFCVSVRLTGSAWWAIGFHASWDWAQTFFYGTSDSGIVAKGHLLTTTPSGSVLWSGGSDGPEGSLLVLPTVLLVLLAIMLAYGRRSPTLPASAAAIEPAAR